jgi:hypothetical protein
MPLALSLLAASTPAARTLPAASDSIARDLPPPVSRTAIVCFVSYAGRPPLPVAASDVRRVGRGALASALEARGHAIVPFDEEVLPLLRAWRVRSIELIEPGFLEALAAQTGADRLLLVDLDVYADRVFLYGRWIFTATGDLAWVDVIEEEMPARKPAATTTAATTAAPAAESPDGRVDWARAVTRAGHRFVDRCREPAVDESAARLVVLPTEAIGVTQTQSNLGTYCLLRSLIESQRWRLADPALVLRTLQLSGCSGALLDQRGRDALTIQFAPDAALLPRLVSFGTQRPASAPIPDEDEPPASSLAEEGRVPLGLALLAIDCATGEIVAATEAYVEPRRPIGLFGTVRDVHLMERLWNGARRVTRALLPDSKGH